MSVCFSREARAGGCEGDVVLEVQCIAVRYVWGFLSLVCVDLFW